MAKEYYVIDGEGNTTWHGKDRDDSPQIFKSFKAAEKRAREIADSDPGVEIKALTAVEIAHLHPEIPDVVHAGSLPMKPRLPMSTS